MNLSLSFATNSLCSFEKVTCPHWGSVSLPIKLGLITFPWQGCCEDLWLVNKSYGTQLTFGRCFFFASFDVSYMSGVYMFKRSKYDLLSTQQTTSEWLRLHGEQIVHLKMHSDLIPLFTKGFLDPSMSHDTKSKSLFIFS